MIAGSGPDKPAAESVGEPERPSPPNGPSFIITIDTEGDNLWSRPSEATVRNAAFLPRFQALCEKYSLKPTYVTNWEMANSEEFQEFGRDLLRRDAGEIGMHLHAWDSPPLEPLTDDDNLHHPYLIEYPEAQLRAKIAIITDKLEETFGCKMVSHRAGRWAFNEVYARALIDAGYRTDCSVTPHVSWKTNRGAPAGSGGSDYRDYPERAYFVDLGDLSREGESELLEVPMTVIHREYGGWASAARGVLGRFPLGRRVAARCWPRQWWLRPNGRNRRQLLAILETLRDEGRDYAEFMLHSSELMPGGSPTFRTADSIEVLYNDLEALFSATWGHWSGRTLREYDALCRPLRAPARV